MGLVLIYNDCLVSVPILPKIRVWDEIQPFHKQEFGISRKQGIMISPITSINERDRSLNSGRKQDLTVVDSLKAFPHFATLRTQGKQGLVLIYN